MNQPGLRGAFFVVLAAVQIAFFPLLFLLCFFLFSLLVHLWWLLDLSLSCLCVFAQVSQERCLELETYLEEREKEGAPAVEDLIEPKDILSEQ